MAGGVDGVGCRGYRARVYGRAAGGVGYHFVVAEELADEFDVRGLAAARACAREFKERLCKLAVLDRSLDIYQVGFVADFFDAVIPFGLNCELAFQRLHLQSLDSLLAGAYVCTVAAAEAVENVDGLDEACAGHGLADGGQCAVFAERCGLHFGCIEHEGTDGSVGAYKCTLIALDTVLGIPFGDEGGHTAFFVAGGGVVPCSIGIGLEVADFEQVAVLCVDGTYDVAYKCRSVVHGDFVVGELCPCGIYAQGVILATAVYGCIVFVDNVLTFLAVGLDDEFLHLFDGEVYGYHFGDAEKCALEDGVGAVAQTDFLCDARCIYVVYSDIMLCEVALNLIGQVLGQLLAFPDCVEQECAAVAQAASDIVHM